MNGFRDYLKCFGAAVSDMALCILILSLRPVFPPEGCAVSFPVGTWLLILSVQILFGILVTERGASVNLYLIGNLAAVVLLVWFVYQGTWQSVNGAVQVSQSRDLKVVSAVLAAVTSIHAAAAAWYLPRANGLLRYVDVLAVAMAFYLWATAEALPAADMTALGSALAAMAANLFAVNQIRTREEGEAVVRGSGTGGKLALLGIAAAIVGITGVSVGAAAGQIHSVVDILLVILAFVWKIFAAVLNVFTLVVGSIVVFFMMILPVGSPVVQERMQENVQEHLEEITETVGLVPPEWFWPAVLTVGGAAAVLFIGMKFRGVRFPRRKRRMPAQKIVRKNHGFSYIRQLLLGLCRAARFELQYLKNRYTAAGLLIYLERMGERRHGARKRTESPGAYVRRLAALAGEERESMERLAALLDGIYYGGREPMSSGECRMYRKLLKGYFDNQSICDSLSLKG